MRILIVDDSYFTREIMTEYVRSYFEGRKEKLEIVEYENGQLLVEDHKQKDIILLDMDMPVLNGYEAGRILRERGEEAYIIFITAHEEVVKEVFKINVFRFLVKEVNQDELEEVLEQTMEDMYTKQKVIVKYEDNYVFIPLKEINYIESLGDTCAFHYNDTYTQSSESLKYWERKLASSQFLRVHRSYIINLGYINSIKEKEVTIGSVPIPIARRKKKQLKLALENIQW